MTTVAATIVLSAADVAHAAEPAAPATEATAVDRGPEAKRLYDQATVAYEREDYGAAARDFAAADGLAPNAVALATALDAATLANDAVLAMSLRDRAETRPADAQLAAAVKAAELRFVGRTGRLRVACVAPCEVTLDGAAIAPGTILRARAGNHVVTLRPAGRSAEEHTVTVKPDALVEVAPRALGAEAGLSPVWFFAALGAATLAGGATITSGVDTASKHDTFVRGGCAGPVHGDCTGAAAQGRDAEVRTNVLLGVTAGLAAATAVVGIVFVRWSSPKSGEVSLSASGPGLVVRGSL